MTRRIQWRQTRKFYRLAVVGTALICISCSSTADPCTGDPAVDLKHGDPRCRANAAILTAELDRLDLFPDLLANLRDEHGEVRLITGVAVRKLSRLDVGFRPFGSASEQEAAIARWKSWWSNNPALTDRGQEPSRTPEPGVDGFRSDAKIGSSPTRWDSPANMSRSTTE